MPFISSVRGSYGAQGRFGRAGSPLLTSTGGTITTAGGYRIHTFTTVGSSTFTASGTGNIQLLVVAGGGGTGWDVGGGGGAGGLCYSDSYPVTSTGYNITVGNGGASLTTNPSGGQRGANGSNSTFGSVTAIGGGGGGSYPTPNGLGTGANGGSGGGAGDANFSGGSATQSSGANYTGFGNNGGTSAGSWGSGGGGGAGSAGANGITNQFVAGGSGRTYTISGTSQVYSGGGYGSPDSGAVYNTGYDFNNNFVGTYGFGANGTGLSAAGGGSQGVVIVRYPI